jgi:hypothetical protein
VKDKVKAKEEVDADSEDDWEVDPQVKRPGMVPGQPRQSLASGGVPAGPGTVPGGNQAVEGQALQYTAEVVSEAGEAVEEAVA